MHTSKAQNKMNEGKIKLKDNVEAETGINISLTLNGDYSEHASALALINWRGRRQNSVLTKEPAER